MKVAFRSKTIDSGTGKLLIGYFNITNDIMAKLVLDTAGWLVTSIQNEYGKLESYSKLI